jgi:two-component sensor histidine kinase
MSVSLKNYTLRLVALAFLPIMVVWLVLIYIFILEEVYDNVDDGLKDRKKEIIALSKEYPERILSVSEYGIGQFRIRPAQGKVSKKNSINNEFLYEPSGDEKELYRVLKTGFCDDQDRCYTLEIRTSTVEEDDLMANLAIGIGVLYLVLVVSMYIIHLLFIRRVWKPFNTLLHNINAYELGNRQGVAPITTQVREFAQLNETIQRMWYRTETIFDQQRTFIGNAAHELQTPIAITINKLELLMEDETLSQAQLQQLSEAKASLTRMATLNKSLLTLARIENRQYEEISPICFASLLCTLIEEYQDLIAFKEITLSITEKSPFSVQMNKDLAVILLSNLLRNAIKYTYPKGKILIEIDKHVFSIANEGKPTPLDADKIFKRFHKGEQDSTSTGLGLAIVKSIVDLYQHIRLQYVYKEEKHTFLIVNF